MAGQYTRLADAIQLAANQVQPRDQVLDAGAFNKLQVQARVLKTGTGGTIKLQHSAVMEEGAWIDLGGSIALNALSNALITHLNFLRYVRWVTDGAVAGDPVVTIDIMAKI